MTGARVARDLHPLAWWVWAIGLGTAASMTTNPLLLVLVMATAAFVVALRHGDHPWARSFRLYLWLGLGIVVIRVVFRVLLGGSEGGTVLVALPEIPLPDWAAGIRLLGPITTEDILAGLYDGLRLAGIVIAVGAANALANPKRLLKSMPAALYEIGSALVVAVTVLPQLADSVQRVRAARALRGEPASRWGGLRRLVVPVLEDALERSMRLAAGMDARGYGRSGSATAGQRRTTGTLMVVGLLGICVGIYAVLDLTAPRLLAAPMLVAGCLLALAGFVSAGRRVERSRYRPDPWRVAETAVAVCGLVTATVFVWVGRSHPLLMHPGLDEAPAVTVTLLAGILVAGIPAFASPPPQDAVLPREGARR
ncbi:energy-coupling factor transporter transmembrane component T [Nocardioides mesophilus]|uniref:Energy-coupling factor transporter transmembrane protein EcfT n=1 Tax=Nocardioides mesophilus TaxID=433659 RepID=A0A7G9R8X1_9ACTN|nr:energy-coupling factor transporter transmembrane component T [Nocardioides mesophilus]QNN52046.1 energy-coupling factor transporter transmembrane protein EcfT [Nocardioides mesophilus]